MGDNGIYAAREAVNIPVVGLSDSSMRYASSLGRGFGVLTVGVWHGLFLKNLSQLYGCDKFFINFIDLGFQPFFIDEEKKDETINTAFKACEKLIDEDKVDVILMGGSYFIGMKTILEEMLEKKYRCYIPVIDPLPTAIYYAESLLKGELNFSKKYIPKRNKTPVTGFTNMTEV